MAPLPAVFAQLDHVRRNPHFAGLHEADGSSRPERRPIDVDLSGDRFLSTRLRGRRLRLRSGATAPMRLPVVRRHSQSFRG